MPAAIADPGTTAIWEQALDRIEAGQMTLEDFVAKQSAWVTQLVAQYRNTTLSIAAPQGPACPQCGAVTRQKLGKTGLFWSCSHYPACMGTVPVASDKTTRSTRRAVDKSSSSRKAANRNKTDGV